MRTRFSPDQLQEKIEVLDGSRGRTTSAAAVRITDLEAMMAFAETLRVAKMAEPAVNPFSKTATELARSNPAPYVLQSSAAFDRTLSTNITLTATSTSQPSPTAAEFNRVVTDLATLRTFCINLATAMQTAPTVTHVNQALADLTAIRAHALALSTALPQIAEYNKVVQDLASVAAYLAAFKNAVPSAAQFNAAVQDLQDLMKHLRAAGEALQKRLVG